MTQVITRYFNSADKAHAAKRRLQNERFPPAALVVYTDAKELAKALKSEKVDAEAVRTYEERLSKRGAVLLAKAGYEPLGAAALARKVTADLGAVDMGEMVEEVHVHDRPGHARSVLANHPFMLSRDKPIIRSRKDDPPQANYHMADWPIPLISRREPTDRFAFPRHARMADWPIPLLSDRKPYDKFAFPRHARMANFPLPLIFRRKPYDKFAFPRHMRMADWPIPLISRRRPFARSLIGRHTRMANWPFPLLINGRQHTNAIIPNHPHMANFPIPLLSDREPYDNSIFPRHARMANFPLPLTVRKEPFRGSIFARHARMADKFLPLVIQHGESRTGKKGAGFSFSKLLGWPTISRR